MAHPLSPPPVDLPASVRRALACAVASTTVGEGLEIARKALAKARATQDERAIAYAGHVFCFFLYRMGKLEELLDVATDVERQLKGVGAWQERLSILSWMCLGACDKGRPDLMLRYAAEAFRYGESQQSALGRAIGLNMLGVAMNRLGDPWQALRMLRTAVLYARESNDARVLCSCLNNLSVTLLEQARLMSAAGLRRDARQTLRDALHLALEVERMVVQLGEAFFQTFTYCNLAEMYLLLGNLDGAELYVQKSLERARDHQYVSIYLHAMVVHANVLLARGNAAAALQVTHQIADQDWKQLPAHLHESFELTRANAYTAMGCQGDAIDSLRRLRQLESARVFRQLRIRSDWLVTRLEADSRGQRQMQRALDLARQHANKVAQLEQLALHDDLTSLGNRRLLEARLPEMLVQARAKEQNFSVVFVDLDHFKRVNDIFGHHLGDQVLRIFAKLLRSAIRETDVVCRIGGEEFVIVLPGLDAARASDLCERLRTQIADYPWSTVASGLSITASMGVASAPEYDMDALLERADAQMYEAKRLGRNRVSA